jgi:hypothetical protein
MRCEFAGQFDIDENGQKVKNSHNDRQDADTDHTDRFPITPVIAWHDLAGDIRDDRQGTDHGGSHHHKQKKRDQASDQDNKEIIKYRISL